MSERTYPLPSGDELSIEANESVWLRTGDLKGLIGDSSLLIQVLALVDSLQQQIKELGDTAVRQGQDMIRLQGLVNKHLQEVGHLREQLAERDRTIALLTEQMKGLEKFPRETEGTGDHVLDFDYLHMIKLEIDCDDRDFSTLDTDDIEDVLLAVEKLREEQRKKALGE
ncbi:hypothetical protein [Paenibacillus polymyxa]|uniref:hypothetical protein n=1 Tax=Paenibacillus polymyxa TaxID=1406 RepID=UPI00287FE851|nr:hypothetical protein [Paenibacillus polymyxa]